MKIIDESGTNIISAGLEKGDYFHYNVSKEGAYGEFFLVGTLNDTKYVYDIELSQFHKFTDIFNGYEFVKKYDKVSFDLETTPTEDIACNGSNVSSEAFIIIKQSKHMLGNLKKSDGTYENHFISCKAGNIKAINDMKDDDGNWYNMVQFKNGSINLAQTT